MLTNKDFEVPTLGECKVASPMKLAAKGSGSLHYITDDEFISYESEIDTSDKKYLSDKVLMQMAGPREKIYFTPSHVHAGIVTCGGLCPGLNDVIRAITRTLWYRYGVRRITGIRYGYRGLISEYNLDLIGLGPDMVDTIHQSGGTILGSSRGGGDRVNDIVDTIERLNLNILFTIGGDGTQKGSLDIAEEIERRHLKVAVIGIPKTIDNDLLFLDKTFGFETSVVRAKDAVSGAHTEACAYPNGIGLVKLMGRDSGFIAAHTALASHEANFVLIPEVPFELEGPKGLFALLENRITKRGHALIVVAEGAGQDLLVAHNSTDASGNKKLGDIGIFLKEKITDYFASKKIEINMKYIDPSYIVRSAPASPTDSVYCERLGINAVHAAMAGKTKSIIGIVRGEFVNLPIKAAVSRRNKIDPTGSLWRDVLDATSQPEHIKN